MALRAERRWQGRSLTQRDWGDLLHQLRFAPWRAVVVARQLARCYPQPLCFDEWADLFEQLAAEHVLATKYEHLI